MQNRIVIIGAGLGGLTAGALLAKKGSLVHVFERESLPGGRALTLDGDSLTLGAYRRILHRFDCWMPRSDPPLEALFGNGMLRGYRLDLGFHLLGFVDHSPLLRLLRREGLDLPFVSSRFGLLTEEGRVHSNFLTYLRPGDVLRVVPNLLRLRFASRRYLERHASDSIEEIIGRYCRGTVARASGIAARLVSTVNRLDRISAHEILRVGRKWNPRARPTGYPRGGSGVLAGALADIIRASGGTVSLNSGVERILVENGRVRGIRVGGGEIPCDLCVSSVPVQDLHLLVGEEAFPGNEGTILRSLEGTGSVCAYYGLRRLPPKLLGKPFTFLHAGLPVEGGAAAGIIDFQTARPDVGMGPPGRYLVQAYIICTPREARDRKIVERLIRALDDRMGSLFPGFREHLEFSLYPTCYHLDGVAKALGQDKPDVSTPVGGLYLVGDCIRSTGIGMNCAADSAFRFVERMTGDRGSERATRTVPSPGPGDPGRPWRDGTAEKQGDGPSNGS